MEAKALELIRDEDRLVKLKFDLPDEKVNKLTEKVMEELDSLLDEIQKDNELQAIAILSGKKDIFIAGADIHEIVNISDSQDGTQKALMGQRVLNKLEDLSIPSIAVIDGACLGGGLELALACTYRISTDSPKTSLGLPEVKLGIIPGFGGTQRLPRLIGLQQSLSLILTGRFIDSLTAYNYCLTDAHVPNESLKEKTHAFVKTILTAKGRKGILARRQRGLIHYLFGKRNPIYEFIVLKLAKKNLLKKTRGFYPAPLAALKLIKKTRSMNLSKGLENEAEVFGKLVMGDISKNLVKLFFIGERIKRDKGINGDAQCDTVSQAGVLGAGTRGGDISWLFTKAEIPVTLKDLSWQAVKKGCNAASRTYKKLQQLGKYNDRDIAFRMNLIKGTLDYTGFDHLDVVIEAVTEDQKIKAEVFRELEDKVRDDTIIASTTGTVPIPEMAKTFKHPERFLGMHFFNPASRIPLVEIIPNEKTSSKTIATIVALTKRLGKTPVKVRNCPGLLVNRLLTPYLNEAFYMLQEGIDPIRMDNSFCDFGMSMGPLTLVDEMGIDMGYKNAVILHNAYGERMQIAEIFSVFGEDKHLLGKKAKKGVYIYDGRTKVLNAVVNEVIARVESQNSDTSARLMDNEIVERALLIMINEASRCLEEKIVENAGYLDIALILTIGFPAFRGGLLRYADTIGIHSICTKINKLKDLHGERFKPSKLLLEMKSKKAAFYGD